MATRKTQNMVATSGDNDLMALFNQAYANASTASNPATMAGNKPTVDQMSVRDRFWDSMNYTYGQQRRASDQSYANAISQQDRAALNKGMQRSSYNAATQANLRNQQIQAQNDIYAQQIADYERQLYQIERDEIADQQWQQQFDESVRQFNVLHPELAGGGGGGSSGTRSSGRKKDDKKDDTEDVNDENLFPGVTSSVIKPTAANNNRQIIQNSPLYGSRLVLRDR